MGEYAHDMNEKCMLTRWKFSLPQEYVGGIQFQPFDSTESEQHKR